VWRGCVQQPASRALQGGNQWHADPTSRVEGTAAFAGLTSLPEDVAWTRHVLAERLQGPTVLAGHSYGGAVISGAATGVDDVIGLVFASAFAPDQGETLNELGSRFPPPPGLAHTQPDSLGFLWFDPAAVPTFFAQDLPVREARVLGLSAKADRSKELHRPGGAAGVEDAAVVVRGVHPGPDDQPGPGAVHGRPHRREHRGDSLQPRLAGLPPSPGRQADPGRSPGRGVGLGRQGEAQVSGRPQ
jgi:hypothetical protein